MKERLPPEVAALLTDEPPELMPGSFVPKELAEYRTDRLYRAQTQGDRPVLIHVIVEHKSSPDHRVGLQLLGYTTQILQQWDDREGRDAKGNLLPLPAVLSMVVYNGAAAWKVPLSLADVTDADENLRPWLPNSHYILVDLGRIDDGRLSRQEMLRVGFLILKHGSRDGDLHQSLRDLGRAALALGFDDLVALERYVLGEPNEIEAGILRQVLAEIVPGQEDRIMSIAAEQWMAEGENDERELSWGRFGVLALLLGILVYGYATGVFSSRKLERATHDPVAFRFIAANEHPDHDTIAVFRRRFLKDIEGLFVQVLQLAREMGMLKVGTIGLDGTKIHANASWHSALSYEHAGKIEAQLKAEVSALVAKAEAADQADVPDGMSIPDELARREERLRRLAEARANIEARAKERFEREQAEYQAKLAAREAKAKATGKKPGGKPPAPPTEAPLPTDQINLTDEKSRIMPVAGGGFDQSYNAQAAVAAGSMLVVAADVTQPPPNDKQQLAPMVNKINALPDSPIILPFWQKPVVVPQWTKVVLQPRSGDLQTHLSSQPQHNEEPGWQGTKTITTICPPDRASPVRGNKNATGRPANTSK